MDNCYNLPFYVAGSVYVFCCCVDIVRISIVAVPLLSCSCRLFDFTTQSKRGRLSLCIRWSWTNQGIVLLMKCSERIDTNKKNHRVVSQSFGCCLLRQLVRRRWCSSESLLAWAGRTYTNTHTPRRRTPTKCWLLLSNQPSSCREVSFTTTSRN